MADIWRAARATDYISGVSLHPSQRYDTAICIGIRRIEKSRFSGAIIKYMYIVPPERNL